MCRHTNLAPRPPPLQFQLAHSSLCCVTTVCPFLSSLRPSPRPPLPHIVCSAQQLTLRIIGYTHSTGQVQKREENSQKWRCLISVSSQACGGAPMTSGGPTGGASGAGSPAAGRMRGCSNGGGPTLPRPPPAGGENADDAFYRYKMPKLQARVRRWVWAAGGRRRRLAATGGCSDEHLRLTCLPAFRTVLQIEGRGNGIKTNVVNNADIAKALDRPADCERLLLLHVAGGDGCLLASPRLGPVPPQAPTSVALIFRILLLFPAPPFVDRLPHRRHPEVLWL